MRRALKQKWPYARGWVDGHLTRAGIFVGRHTGRVAFSTLALSAALRYVDAWFRWSFWAHYFRLTDREWFDHRINLHRWTSSPGELAWVERGIYARELMRPGDRVLDVCCGDGFYPHHFFASTPATVDAVDKDPAAISHARRHFRHPQVTYHVMDVVRDPLPPGPFAVVTWDAAIEHFDAGDVRTVLRKIVDALADDGVLSGSTPLVEVTATQDVNPFHSFDYSSTEELVDLLKEFFPAVATFVTEHPGRRTAYFRASADAGRLGRFPPSS